MDKVLDKVLNKDKILSGKDLIPEIEDFNICSIKHWFLILISWNLNQLRSAFAFPKVEILLLKEEILNLTLNSKLEFCLERQLMIVSDKIFFTFTYKYFSLMKHLFLHFIFHHFNSVVP